MYVGTNVFRSPFTIPTYRNINLLLYLRIGHNQFDLSATGDIKPISPIYQQDALASYLFFPTRRPWSNEALPHLACKGWHKSNLVFVNQLTRDISYNL